MTSAQRLLAAFESGALLPPTADGPNLVDLSRALAGIAGAHGVESTQVSTALARLIGQPEHMVFVLVDGLGMSLLEKIPASGFLPTHLALPMRTVFPSTTAVALTSLATGEWPLRHGITGWWTHVPEIENTAAILHFVARSSGKSLSAMGVTAQQAFPVDSWMGRATRDTLSLLPKELASTVYSTYFCGGKPHRAYSTLPEAVDTILTRVRTTHRPTYTYLYYEEVDSAIHRSGTAHREIARTLERLDAEMARLWEGLKGHGTLALTADHGFLDIPDGGRRGVKFSDPLMDMLRCPPSGDARAMYFHVREDAQGKVCRALEERLGERFAVLGVEEALQMGLFGPGTASPEARVRMGDVLALSLGEDVIEYRGGNGSGHLASHAAHHSGLSPQEMRIPLVIAAK